MKQIKKTILFYKEVNAICVLLFLLLSTSCSQLTSDSITGEYENFINGERLHFDINEDSTAIITNNNSPKKLTWKTDENYLIFEELSGNEYSRYKIVKKGNSYLELYSDDYFKMYEIGTSLHKKKLTEFNKTTGKNGTTPKIKNGHRLQKAGWEYILSSIPTPSTAKLIKCEEKENYGGNCNTFLRFEFDAQNSFGAVLRQHAVIPFKDNKPCYLLQDGDMLIVDLAGDDINDKKGLMKPYLQLYGCVCD